MLAQFGAGTARVHAPAADLSAGIARVPTTGAGMHLDSQCLVLAQFVAGTAGVPATGVGCISPPFHVLAQFGGIARVPAGGCSLAFAVLKPSATYPDWRYLYTVDCVYMYKPA
jgi:hypothetical protein